MSLEKRSRPKVAYLAPTGRADTDRENGKEPRMNLAEPCEECEEGGPYTDEEDSNKDEDVPVLEISAPQERPVLSVGLGNKGLEKKRNKRRAKLDSPRSTSNRATPVRRGTTARACDGKAYDRSWEPSVASDGSTLRLKSAKQEDIRRVFTDGRLTWEPTQQKDHEQEAQDRKRPNDANDPPGSDRCRLRAVQLVTPVPERGNPDLLRTLNDTRAEDPHFRGSPSFFTKVETEEGETTRRSYRIRPSCNGGNDVMCREQALGDVWEPNEEESDTKEEPRDGEHPNRRLETEEQVPDDRSTEEYRTEDIKLDVHLPARTREQYDLVTGRTQHLLNSQLPP